MSKNIVVVSGNLGTGKTSLTELIGNRLNWHIVCESAINNPYLSDYYTNMKSWAFHLQIYFLGHRSKQYLEVAAMKQHVILDRCIYEDINVFAYALHKTGNITERDYNTYIQLYNIVECILPKPNLLIYLKAPVTILMKRIKKRGLDFDYKGINEDYLTLIDSFYDKWIQTFNTCPVLTINTDEINYIDDKECLENIIRTISKRLA